MKHGGWIHSDVVDELVYLFSKRQRQLEGASRKFPLVHFSISHFYSKLTEFKFAPTTHHKCVQSAVDKLLLLMNLRLQEVWVLFSADDIALAVTSEL